MLATRTFTNSLFTLGSTDKMTEANHIVHDGKLKMGSIVRLKSYQANSVKGKRFVEYRHLKNAWS